jgi:hypothetical protein
MDSYLNVDELRQQVPAFFFKRFDLFNKAVVYFLIPIDYGFAYLLRSIRTKWQELSDANGASKNRNLKIEFVQSYAGRTLQNERYPARLISTPAEPGVTVIGAPAPYDNTAFDVNMTATPVKNNILLNYVYQRRETLNCQLRFDVIQLTGELDTYIDILFEGYYIPDRILDEWQ